jgi:dTDP-4-amino-4,6-dideoxygalactose transaminase
MIRMSVKTDKDRIFLSPPHMSGKELDFIHQAFESNYIAPLGPMVDAFEEAFCNSLGTKSALAVNSGTAALHLALQIAGVGPGDEVFISTLTFIGSVSPVIYLGAKPVFIDSEPASWNMDPNLLEEDLKHRSKKGDLPKALILVHLYGQCADIEPIRDVCEANGIVLIEDAAEALGASYKGHYAGTFGKLGIFSFNGNKIITTSGGGMLVSNDENLIQTARFLSQQARDPAPHYEHSQIGYNYRMSNIIAAIGLGQLKVLDERIAAKRRIFNYYRKALKDIPGIAFMPEATFGKSNRWLTCITIDPADYGADREMVRTALERRNIEARPIWKPMHLQPVFKHCQRIGGKVAEQLFHQGLCLPSGTAMTTNDLNRVLEVILSFRR